MENKQIYEKFFKVKKEIKSKVEEGDLKKAGKSDFTKSKYVKLEDLQPVIDEVLEKNLLLAKTSMTTTEVIYELIDLENNQVLKFTLPMVLKGLLSGSEAQSLGASITYMRRYTLLTIFELSVPDEAETEKNFDKHDIFVIQKRIQELITAKSKDFGDLKEFYKVLGIDSKGLIDVLGYCNKLDKFEKQVKAIKYDKK